MSVLPFPLTAIAKIDRPRKGLFWAGAPKCSGGACQVAWELACRDKDDGGLGLKDLAVLNKSLMMKQVHKLFTGESNPWADWIRFWYDEGRANEDTACWRDIKKLIPEYRALTDVALGDGETTSFWHDTWSEAGVLRDALPALYSHCLDADVTVAEVVAAGGLSGQDLQPRLTAAARVDLSLLDDALLAVSLQPRRDERWLRGSRSNTVRAGDLYKALRVPIGGPPLAQMNWDCFAPKKVKVFFWILRHGRTRTRASLHRHGALDTADCPFCPGTPEDEGHLFATCPRLQHLWARLLPGQAPPTTALGAAEAIGGLFPALPGTSAHTMALAALWVVWKSRNAKVFHDELQDDRSMARHLQEHVKLWVSRAPSKLDVQPLKLWCQTVIDVN
ncbi:unnamed protein product [Urochloa decumbens]|uniref:Reverse transcriptase zinc-binding domain-containing protein n=1 Tax=Urochloa decumbens TaxID=240449 RepID=A0ABC8WKR1_9POAL